MVPVNSLLIVRSGRSMTIVTQYDVELFQKIEALTGHKMEEYPAEQEAVLLLLERVGEAQRISTMQVSRPCLKLLRALQLTWMLQCCHACTVGLYIYIYIYDSRN